MRDMKKIISTVLAVCMLASLSCAFAIDAGNSRAVIGADLTAEQKTAVYKSFGIEEGSVTELTVNNSEERDYLDGLVEDSVIGTKSISCVYIETLAEGTGLQVSVSNVNWCTQEMYVNALVTAGITDAKLIVASPVTVSGTAALTGVFKAYEDITGEKLDEAAKVVGTQELVITAELADEIGSYDAVQIVNELKLILDDTVNMTDDELKAEILKLAEQYNVSISDGQVKQILKLVRSLEGLDDEELKARVEQAQEWVKTLAQAQSTVQTVVESVKNFFVAVGDFLRNIFGGSNT
jgi:uncharacterized protein YpuA (DUF1002 family)